MEQPKEYFAFISYQHKDVKLAEWLRKKIEHYHLPSSLRKKDASLPKEIRPIFRDTLELAGGVLAEEIQTALQQSKYLIVICSPNSAKSPWVNKEVQTFIDQGREKQIIPFIIDGTPFSDNEETECFPPALRLLKGDKELLGININDMGRDAAAVKVVSRMFGLNFDTLWQRYEREERRKRWMIIGGVLFLLLISIGVGTFIWYQNIRLKTIQSRVLAEKASSLIEEGDSYTASQIALEALNMAYTPEAESSLREANISNNAILDKTTEYVTTVCISPDGQHILSTSKDSTVQIWDFQSGACIKHFKWQDRIQFLSYSPDGKSVAVASYKNIGFINPSTGQNIRIIKEGYINSIHFGSDNKLAVASYDSIRIWDAQTGKLLLQRIENSYNIKSVCFNPESKQIAYPALHFMADSYMIYIWDLSKDTCWHLSGGHDGFINSVNYSPDGKQIVSASADGTLKIWDAVTGDSIRAIKRDTKFISAKFSNDSKLIVSASEDHIIRIWNSTGTCIDSLTRSPMASGIPSFTPDNRHLVFDDCWNVRIWNFLPNVRFRQIPNSLNERHVAFTPDSKYFATSSVNYTIRGGPRNTIRVRDSQTGTCVNTFPCNNNNRSIYSLNYSFDGTRIIAACSDTTIRVIDASTGDSLLTMKGHTSYINHAEFSSNDKYILSASEDSTVRLWNSSTGKMIRILHKHPYPVKYAKFSPDGKLVVSESYDSIHIYRASDGTCLKRTFIRDYSGYKFITFMRNKRHTPFQFVFSSSGDSEAVRVTGNAKSGIILVGHTNKVESIALSSDGHYIASSSKDGTIRIWDSASGFCISTVQGINPYGSQIVFSPDGKQITSTSGSEICVIDFPPLQELIDQTRERFKDRPLTPEERRNYYLE